MLNKDICQRCQGNHKHEVEMNDWGDFDEKWWENPGIVHCPVRVDGTERGWLRGSYFKKAEVRGVVPEHCLCRFEQLIAQGLEKKDA